MTKGKGEGRGGGKGCTLQSGEDITGGRERRKGRRRGKCFCMGEWVKNGEKREGEGKVFVFAGE